MEAFRNIPAEELQIEEGISDKDGISGVASFIMFIHQAGEIRHVEVFVRESGEFDENGNPKTAKTFKINGRYNNDVSYLASENEILEGIRWHSEQMEKKQGIIADIEGVSVNLLVLGQNLFHLQLHLENDPGQTR